MKKCDKCSWNNGYTWNNRKCGCDNKDESYCPIEHYDNKHIEKYQPIYICGIGFGCRTFCYNTYEENGEKIIETNNGYTRRESDVLNNNSDVCVSKKQINKSLCSSMYGKLIPEDGWI